MASYIEPKFHTLKAGADLSAKQFHLVKHGADADHVVVASVLGEKVLGSLMDAPEAEQFAEIAMFHGGKVKAAATIAVGDELSATAAAQAGVALTGHYVFGIAMEAGVAGDVIAYKEVFYQKN